MTFSWTFARRTVCAAALTIVAVNVASAAPARLATNTNLRLGPGTNFGVAATVPAGSVVDVIRCDVQWCNVLWRGRPGYMVARNLLGPGGPGPVVAVAPAPVVVGPPVYYGGGPYWGPRYYYGPRYYGPRYRHWRRW
jgi:uncharacterized protein YraI